MTPHRRARAPEPEPNHLGDAYDSWWISSQYVNTYGNAKGFTGCHGGASMKVDIGDVLAIDMKLTGTTWTQTVTNQKTSKSVDFAIDLMGQDQDQALFLIEDTYVSPSADLIFLSSVLTRTRRQRRSRQSAPAQRRARVLHPSHRVACKGVAATSPD